jgi:hypothetical protein
VKAPGFVVLTQTCDLVRSCESRPYVELAALIEVNADRLREIQKCLRPAFAFIPALSEQRLVADLDRTMTVEKTVLASLARQPGFTTDREIMAFQAALARNKARFAFPDDFVAAVSQFQRRLRDRAGRDSVEGRHVDALSEIRVSAVPSWDAEEIALTLWLIKQSDPPAARMARHGRNVDGTDRARRSILDRRRTRAASRRGHARQRLSRQPAARPRSPIHALACGQEGELFGAFG